VRGGGWAGLVLVSRSIQRDSGGVIAAATVKHQSWTGRSRVLAPNWLSLASSTTARPTKGRIRYGSGWRGMSSMERPCERWEKIEEGDGQAAEERDFYRR
jgi:hypothetical protein